MRIFGAAAAGPVARMRTAGRSVISDADQTSPTFANAYGLRRRARDLVREREIRSRLRELTDQNEASAVASSTITTDPKSEAMASERNSSAPIEGSAGPRVLEVNSGVMMEFLARGVPGGLELARRIYTRAFERMFA